MTERRHPRHQPRYAECRARHDDPFSGRHHVCILQPDHVGPHWGIATNNPDSYHEWNRT